MSFLLTIMNYDIAVAKGLLHDTLEYLFHTNFKLNCSDFY